MSVLLPAANRMANSGAYARHTALNGSGCGVPLGIRRYRSGGAAAFTPIDLTSSLSGYGPDDDITAVLYSAFNTYRGTGKRLMIPEGDWTVNGTVGSAYTYGNHTTAFCGAGIGNTRLWKRAGTSTMFNFGAQTSFVVASGFIPTSGDIAQGGNQVTMAPAAIAAGNFQVGRIMKIFWSDVLDPTEIAAGNIPTIHTEGLSFNRCHTTTIWDVTGNVVTFYPPVPFQAAAGREIRVCPAEYETWHHIGVEDMSIRLDPDSYPGIMPANTINQPVVAFQEMHSSWLLNVEVSNTPAAHYGVGVQQCTRFDMRGCYVHGYPDATGSNHSLVLIQGTTSSIFEDNITINGGPCYELNFGCNANVFHANYLDNGDLNTNHGPHNFGNLYIRNIFGPNGGSFHCDGYFGSAEGDTFIGNSCVKNGLVLRRFSFNMNSYGNRWASTADTRGFDWRLGQGVPFMGGVDPQIAFSELLAGSFPADYYTPTQYVKCLTRISDTEAIWEIQGSAYLYAGSYPSGDGINPGAGHRKILMSCGQTETAKQIITSKKWKAEILPGGSVPLEGQLVQWFAGGAEGFYEHNLDVINTLVSAGDFILGPNITNKPSSSIGTDQIWEPEYTSAPAGDGVDEIDWSASGCSWFTNGGQQYGIVDRSNPDAADSRSNPAGRRYIDDTIFPVSNQVAQPSFTPSPGTFPTAQSVSIACATAGAEIRYTVDGSSPSASSTLYTGPISVSATTTIRAIGIKSGMTDSIVRSGLFQIVPVPAAPSGLTATPVSSSQINLAWTRNSTDETGFKIYRGTASGSLTLIATIAAGSVGYNATSLSPSTQYFFAVKATNAGGDSTASNEANATTQGLVNFDLPSSPTNGQVYTLGARKWKFNGTGWRRT